VFLLDNCNFFIQDMLFYWLCRSLGPTIDGAQSSISMVASQKKAQCAPSLRLVALRFPHRLATY